MTVSNYHKLKQQIKDEAKETEKPSLPVDNFVSGNVGKMAYPIITCPFCLNENTSATQYCDVCKNYGRVQILPLK